MRTVELFAGIGGFRIAADQCGFETVWANDSNAASCEVYRKRFGADQIVEGDINEVLGEVPAHDLLTGGFPCQPFSSAGKKQGIRDPRGTLFGSIVEVIQKKRPEYFILENVKRLLSMEKGDHFRTIISALSELGYFVEWRLLNALHFGLAQNRERVIIVGRRKDSASDDDYFQEGEVGICLAAGFDLSTSKDFNCNLACDAKRWPAIESRKTGFSNWGMASEGRFYQAKLSEFSSKSSPVYLSDVLQEESDVSSVFDFTDSTIERMASSESVNKFVSGVQILSNQAGGARMGYTVFGIDGVAPTLTATTSRHYERYRVGECYRRLTNVEYARLQGFPEDHCSSISTYGQYGLYGNAVPPPLAKWVMSRLDFKGVALEESERVERQQDLFADVV